MQYEFPGTKQHLNDFLLRLFQWFSHNERKPHEKGQEYNAAPSIGAYTLFKVPNHDIDIEAYF